MIRFMLLFSILSSTFISKAIQTDTSAYQMQRLKVNTLLSQRSAKFGQYDQSLSQRTGIFGLQTKQDIKNSNEILRQIVLTDNNIFKELKVLMEYKDEEVRSIRRNANDYSLRIQNYKTEIKKLQNQIVLLRADTARDQQSKTYGYYAVVILLLLLVFSISYFLRVKRLKEN